MIYLSAPYKFNIDICSVVVRRAGLLITSVLMALMAMNITPVTAADNIEGKTLSNAGCIACHGHEQLDLSPASLQKCQQCHQYGNTQPGLSKVGLSPRSEPSLESVENNKNAQRLAPTAGMRFPMYTQGSRLGDKPNEMVLIPSGKFTMGTNERLPDEGPAHEVNLAAFYIDIYEVTNLQYKAFNDATKRRSPGHFRNRSFPGGKADHPVTFVSWEDANVYCLWAGKRLPTDQEWEKAARGTDGRMFPWGQKFDVEKANTPLRWQRIGQFGDTTPVGAFANGASAYGVYDMSGNVWEWTASWYKPYPKNNVPSESYGEQYKTLKGGSWFDCSFYNCGISAPVFNRAFFAKKVKNDSFGFRCAKDG